METEEAHVHVWEPASEIGMARYRCRCGTTAYRDRKEQIAAYKNRPYREPINCRGYEGRTPALPSLEYYDRTPRG